MYSDQEESAVLDDYRLEMENRIRNLVWTVSGDYSLEVKPDVETFLRSRNIALYDGIKQGGLAKYFDRDALSMYLLKKIYCDARQGPLMTVAQLCVEEAVGHKLDAEREGVRNIRRKACEDILELDFKELAATPLGHLKAALLREELDGAYEGTRKIRGWMEEIHRLRAAGDTMDVIRAVDSLYNQIVEPNFEKNKKTLEQVLAVTVEELAEFSWKDFLREDLEDLREDTMETYLEKISQAMTNLDMNESRDQEEDKKQEGQKKKKILVVDEKALAQMYSYVEKNFGKSYLTPAEQKNLNYQFCRGIHGDCSLYCTEGILQNPVLRNYQYEYARKQKDKNIMAYYDQSRVVKRNIQVLTDMLRKALLLRSENQEILSDRGRIIPAALWKVGRSEDARLFKKEIKNDAMNFVVDVLIDASGSQRSRQGQVALQAFIISEALSNLDIPFRVTSFCTFWDYTILQKFRDYDDSRKKNGRIFEYMTSSNNRDGLAVKAVGSTLLQREEENKVLIILSDGKPYDVVVNRPNSRNPEPYRGRPAILDTGFEVRRLRQSGAAVLGVFVGEETELDAERKIFGKDFAYIRTIKNFSNVAGRYLLKQIEE